MNELLASAIEINEQQLFRLSLLRNKYSKEVEDELHRCQIEADKLDDRVHLYKNDMNEEALNKYVSLLLTVATEGKEYDL